MAETKPMSTTDFVDEAAKKAAEEKEKKAKAEKEAAAKASGMATKDSDPAATPTAPYPSQAQADAIRLGKDARDVTAKEADKVDYKTR